MNDDLDRECCDSVARKIGEYFKNDEDWKPVETIKSGDPEMTVILKNKWGPTVRVTINWGRG